MRHPGIAASLLLLSASCGGITTVGPTAPSVAGSTAAVLVASPTPSPTPPARSAGPDIPAGLVSTQQVVAGSVGPLSGDAVPCYLERYPCEKYSFTMHHDGAVEVTLTWQGGERAMLIQLYRAGAGLVHEDLAPRGGLSRITFRRTDISATDYELRVVNMEPGTAHAFTLTLTTWE